MKYQISVNVISPLFTAVATDSVTICTLVVLSMISTVYCCTCFCNTQERYYNIFTTKVALISVHAILLVDRHKS